MRGDRPVKALLAGGCPRWKAVTMRLQRLHMTLYHQQNTRFFTANALLGYIVVISKIQDQIVRKIE
jgi:hypothetical protein